MILVIGARASGKLEYIKSLGYSDEQISVGTLDARPAVYALEQLVDRDPAGSAMLLDELAKKEVVACCEVGSGIIPAVRRDRESREATGRLCVLLAKEAERVVRMVSGIPVVIKDVSL